MAIRTRSYVALVFAIAFLPGFAYGQDRETEARRLFVEAALIEHSGPCAVAPSLAHVIVRIFTLGSDSDGLRRFLAKLLPCLEHYKKAIKLQQRILEEYPETEAAMTLATGGYPTEEDLDKIIDDLKSELPMPVAKTVAPKPKSRPQPKAAPKKKEKFDASRIAALLDKLLDKKIKKTQIARSETDHVEGDREQELAALRVRAEGGDAEAQCLMGYHFITTDPMSYSEAWKWFYKAAEQNHSRAAYELGIMYYYGRGVLQDYLEALKWFRNSADREAEAQFQLGLMYWSGHGVTQNFVQAYMWFNIASIYGGDKAGHERSSVAIFLSPDNVLMAQSLSREWIEKHMKVKYYSSSFCATIR